MKVRHAACPGTRHVLRYSDTVIWPRGPRGTTEGPQRDLKGTSKGPQRDLGGLGGTSEGTSGGPRVDLWGPQGDLGGPLGPLGDCKWSVVTMARVGACDPALPFLHLCDYLVSDGKAAAGDHMAAGCGVAACDSSSRQPTPQHLTIRPSQ
jgi:hypothetical protein